MKNIYYSVIAILCLFIIVSCSDDSPTGTGDTGGNGSSTTMYQLVVSADPAGGGSVSPGSDEYEEGTSVEITATPNDDWVFSEWTGDHTGTTNPASVTMNSDKDITALFIKREYPLTVNIQGEGAVSEKVVQDKTTDYEAGTTVELTANPAGDWVFVEWQGDIEGDVNPETITIDQATEVTAVFERKEYPLTVNKEGEGTVAEEVIQAKTTEYPFETEVELTANAADGWEFVEWQGDLEGGENPQRVTIDGKKTVTAIFEIRGYPLTVNIEGEGSVKENVLSPKTTNYEEGTDVELTAEPADGWRFTGWDGDLEGTENPQTITIDSDKSVTANFERRDYPLTINIEGEGSVDEEVIQAKTTDYPFETNVQLTANSAEGWVFSHWEGDAEGEENPVTIEVTDEKEVTAVFERDYFALVLQTEGEGAIETTLSTGRQNEEGFYEYGSEIELTATASDNWKFSGWSGMVDSAENLITVEIGTENTLTASFEREEFTLDVTTDGEGTVSETLVSGTKTEAGYLYESVVELTAETSEGWEFVEWSGDISGTDNPTTVTIDSDKNVTAVFQEISYSLNIELEGTGTYDIALLSGSEVGDGYSYGSEIEITIKPEDDWNFVHWSGDLDGTNNPVTVTIQSDLSATANLDNSPFAGGNGSELYPYQVSTVEQLQEIRNYTNEHFVQINDIDASITNSWNGGEGFKPIGDDILRFTGVYNGNEFKISNLFINYQSCCSTRVGLFGEIKGSTIKFVKLINVEIYGSNRTGAIAGDASTSSIEDVFVSGIVEGSFRVGGLVGNSGSTDIIRSTADVQIQAMGTAGGIAGYVSSALIYKNSSSGSVTLKSNSNGNTLGGLIGEYRGLIETRIVQSYSTSDVTGNDVLGGLIGVLIRARLSNSYATGKISGQNRVGGSIGINDEYSRITRVYSIGEVVGNDDVGGLVGLNAANIEFSFWNTNSTNKSEGVGRGSADGTTGLTTSEMQGTSVKENMTEFDWNDIWITTNEYPILRWQED